MAHQPWIETEDRLKNEISENDSIPNQMHSSDKKTITQSSNSCHQRNYSVHNEAVTRDSCKSPLIPKKQPQDFSKPKINSQQYKDDLITSNGLHLNRFKVLNEFSDRVSDEIFQEPQNISNSSYSSATPNERNPINLNLEIILEEGSETMHNQSKILRNSNIPSTSCTQSKYVPITRNKLISIIESKQPTSNEEELRLFMLSQDQNLYMNRQILQPWDTSTPPQNLYNFEKRREAQDTSINHNRATCLDCDDWRTVPNEIYISTSEDEFRGRLQQEHYPTQNYANLQPSIGIENRSSNPYFYSILDDELKLVPGGPKRWRYLMRDLIRTDSNIMRADRWRFLINELKQAHSRTAHVRHSQ